MIVNQWLSGNDNFMHGWMLVIVKGIDYYLIKVLIKKTPSSQSKAHRCKHAYTYTYEYMHIAILI